MINNCKMPHARINLFQRRNENPMFLKFGNGPLNGNIKT